ncbi:MAG: winged helix-turn-helix domain-containing protein [Ahniella sp.]|nr:winged helix-turn-helix domain-containing protein [Ahniella sp.]
MTDPNALALTSAAPMPSAPFYRLGPFRLDAVGKRLQLGENRLDTDAHQIDVLLCLIRAYPGIVAKDDLIERVWGGRFVTDAALHKSISELRKVLREAGDGQDWIETRHRRGYQLREAAIAEFPELPKPSTAEPATSPSMRFKSRVPALGSLLVLGLMVWAGVWWWRHEPEVPLPERPDVTVVEVPESTKVRLRGMDRPALVATIRESMGQDDPLVLAAIEALRDPSAATSDPARLALADKFAGIRAYRAGEFDQAMAWYRHALDGFVALEDRAEQANVLNNMGVLLSESGQDPELGARWFAESLALREALGDAPSILASHKNLANLWLEAGRLPEAEAAVRAYVSAAEQVGQAADRVDALLLEGDVALANGNGDAGRWFAEAKSLALQNGLALAAASAEQRLGRVALQQGDARAAQIAFQSAMKLYEQTNETHQRAIVLYNLANADEALGDVAAALAHYSEVLDTAPASDSTLRVDAELGRVRALWKQGDQDGARSALDAAQREATTLSNAAALAPVLISRSVQALLDKQPTAARAHLESARGKLGASPEWELGSALALQDAWVSIAHGEFVAALQSLDRLADAARVRKDLGLLARIDQIRSYAHLGAGEPDRALAYSMAAAVQIGPVSKTTQSGTEKGTTTGWHLGLALLAGLLIGGLLVWVTTRR